MLADADASLACWLARHLPADFGIRFDAPRPSWADQPPEPPFVDVFLSDVRQDGDGRAGDWADVRDDCGRVVGRQRAPQRYRLRYLLTAWADAGAGAEPNGSRATAAALAARPEVAEHELLGLLLCACATQDALPDECLHGSLAGTGLPTLLRCAPADGRDDLARLWTGFGLPPRAFLDLLLIVPVLPPLDRDLAPPAREITLDLTAARTGSAATTEPRGRPLGSTRRWERKTVTEHAPPPGRDGSAPAL